MNHRDRNNARPEDIQADPQLQLSSGRANGLQIALVAAFCLLLVSMVVYGLNNQRDETVTASSPSTETTGAAPAPSPSQPPAKMPGENGQPATPQNTGAPQQPAAEPQKPGLPADSAR